MKKIILSNGLTLIYKHIENDLSSFSIAFEAGANVESEKEIGLAHIVEHMVFKGTNKRNEYQINTLSDEIFGMNNAMTNYPYVVYYGTSLSSDFEKGFELYSDILLNPSFTKKGFKEEIEIICEELKEWKDDLQQYCEDEMFKNAFKNRRIRELIIGNEESIRGYTIEDVINFYNKYYTADNCVISVVSSLEYEDVLSIVLKYFGDWNKRLTIINPYIDNKKENIYENNIPGRFITTKKDIMGSKIQYCFPIHKLNEDEIKSLKIFNLNFGVGTSSILYDEIRTKNGLVYDISSSIKNEKGIKIFKIALGTSKENEEKAINIINNEIDKIKQNKDYFNQEKINKSVKSIKLRNNLDIERSIVECLRLAVYEIMYRDTTYIDEVHKFKNEEAKSNKIYSITENYDSILYKQFDGFDKIDSDSISDVINKVLVNPTVQIITREKTHN